MGKTALLHHLNLGKLISFDDAATRNFALSNPRGFLDQLDGPLILDEVTLVPELFLELKRRVDEYRRQPQGLQPPTFWLTGSNQTLLQRHVRESLAGRASYFDLNTLSVHEIGELQLSKFLFSGGWPALNVTDDLEPKQYVNDLIATFIEKDIVSAAGIERKAAFSKALGLIAGRVGQILNASDLAKNCGVSVSTLQSWIEILEQNGILRQLQPYYTNLNNRLIKSPKIFFEDVSLATRLQGWSEAPPIMVSPYFGNLCENIAISEVSRFFINRGVAPQIHFLRSKEKVEVDLIIALSNQRYVAAEIKFSAQGFTDPKKRLLESLNINIVEHWVICFSKSDAIFPSARTVAVQDLWSELGRLEN